MHPTHVADFVAAEVDELRSRAAESELPICAIELEEKTRLYVSLELERWQRLATVEVAPALLSGPAPLGPGGLPIGVGLVSEAGLVQNVPDLSVRPTRVQWILHCDLTDFDSQAPTAELLRADRTPLPPAEWPADPENRGIVPGHPNWNRPWFCRKGFREFHSHPEHQDEPWDLLRGHGASLHGLVLGLVSDLHERFLL